MMTEHPYPRPDMHQQEEPSKQERARLRLDPWGVLGMAIFLVSAVLSVLLWGWVISTVWEMLT